MFKYLILPAIFIVTACASVSDTDDKPRGIAAFDGDPRLGEQVDRICFSQSIDGFSNAERDTVVLHRSHNDRYIVEVNGICSSLRNAQTIGLDSYTSCLRENDYMIVSESAFSLNDNIGPGPDRCLIDKMYRWDEKAKAEDDETDDSEDAMTESTP